MKIEELVIDGFKSYAVRTTISDWDAQFNAITGLNGSGKSNILDAICFVLGITSMSTVRAQNLQELIYKRGQAGVTKASVTITFSNDDEAKSPIGFEKFSKISVTRQISIGNQPAKYLINGHRATKEQILNLFQSVQLNINNPNFLIMQGKITKMLNMKPTEILNLIEEAAGTKAYEAQREKSTKLMNKKNQKLELTEQLLREEVEPKLNQLKTQKSTVIEYQKVIKDLETLSRAVAAHDYKSLKEEFAHREEKSNENKLMLEKLALEIETLNKEISILNSDLIKMKKQKAKDLNNPEIIKKKEEEETNITNDITRLTTTRDLKLKSQNEDQKKVSQLKQKLTETENLLNNQDGSYKSLEEEVSFLKNKLRTDKEALQRKEDLLSTLSTGLSSKGSTDGGYSTQLNLVKKQLSDEKLSIEKNKLRISHLEKELSSNKMKLDKNLKDIENIKVEINEKQQVLKSITEKLAKSGFNLDKYNELRLKHKDLQNEYQRANSDLQSFLRNNPNFEFKYNENAVSPTSVKGFAGELFELPESKVKYTTALEVCAGGKLFNVVVDNEHTGSSLLDKGKLTRRVTIIPLTKISSRVVESDRLAKAKRIAPNKVELALNLVNYGDDVTKAIQYVFGNRLICDDPDTAQKVTFDPQVRVGSITLEGDFYDPEGRLSGGSRRSTSNILGFLNYKQYKERVDQIKSKISEITLELRKMASLSESTRDDQVESQKIKYQIEALERKLNNGDSASFVRQNEEITKEIQNLGIKIKESEQMINSYNEEVSKIENDMKEFNSDGAKKLRELKVEVVQNQKALQKEELNYRQKSSHFTNFKVEVEQCQNDKDSLVEEIKQSEKALEISSSDISKCNSDIEDLTLKQQAIRISLKAERERLIGLNEELNEMNDLLNKKKVDLTEAINRKNLTEENFKRFKARVNESAAELKEIAQEYEFVKDEKRLTYELEQYPITNIAASHDTIDRLSQQKNQLAKKGGDNSSIMDEINAHEKREVELRKKIQLINRDKGKIEETIQKLDDYKKTDIVKTYEHVSKDFGQIFGDLLPQAFSKLVPTDPNDVTKGLEVRVQLGNVWKESLVELSGGQRSLVALALIMSLLQYKPAPVYILDEVDAALDLSHTQNIGHLIKTRFKGAQFIVVSLKEGMFTNANRLFKVRFQEGTSVVTAT